MRRGEERAGGGGGRDGASERAREWRKEREALEHIVAVGKEVYRVYMDKANDVLVLACL